MKTKKMSLANIQGKLSRAEMKNIMAGSGSWSCTHYGIDDYCFIIGQSCGNGGSFCYPTDDWSAYCCIHG